MTKTCLNCKKEYYIGKTKWCGRRCYKKWVLERKNRKSLWMERATAHFDTPEIRQQASDMFDKANDIHRSKLIDKQR